MKYPSLILALSLGCFTTASAAELLLNGNFEGPTVTNGNGANNVGTVPTNWTVADPGTPTTANANLSNLVSGTVTTGTGVTNASQYLAPCPDDKTTNAKQSLDGNGQTVVVFQTFSLSSGFTSPLDIKVDFGGRDSGSASGTGSTWQLVNTSNNAVLASSANASKPATGAWLKNEVVTPTLTLAANTTYKFIVTLDNPDQMDAASITTVPEPSTTAALGGLLLLAGGWRFAGRSRQPR